MGEEIITSHFSRADFRHFAQCLESETQLLSGWFRDHHFDNKQRMAGYELEAWLTDNNFQPSPSNQAFLEAADSPLLTHELAQFNVELNAEPHQFSSTMLSDFEQTFQHHWHYCQSVASRLQCHLVSIGILPTLTAEHLTLENISPLERYRALNEQVLQQRQGRDFQLNISGREALKSIHKNVMMEAASTSLQVHLQVPQDLAVRYYNASIIMSAPLVAIAANAPFLFGRDLWAETRIPVFEQSVDVGGFNGAAQGPVHRVSFGTDYARHSLLECFEENLQHFPVLLPMPFNSDETELKYLGLHNGTIWRWNRPLIGFNQDGTPHLRIEQRVMSSGPSVPDNIANMALFFGLVHFYATRDIPAETEIEFAQARDNFYTAARHGINDRINWPGCERCSIRQLLLNRLLDEAETGLRDLGINDADIDYYLGIIEARAERNQTGSDWQRAFVSHQGHDMKRLTENYYRNQQTSTPVHCWDYQSS